MILKHCYYFIPSIVTKNKALALGSGLMKMCTAFLVQCNLELIVDGFCWLKIFAARRSDNCRDE